MPAQTDAEYYAAAEYHDPHSVLKNLIHAACHRKQRQNTMQNTAAEYNGPHSVINNLIHAACYRKQMQNTMP